METFEQKYIFKIIFSAKTFEFVGIVVWEVLL